MYGNIIQARNTSLGGGYHVAYTAYNLDGTKSKLLLQHHTNQVPTQAEKYAYSYDHVGRPTQTTYQLNDNPTILHTQMHYDQRGQVIQMLRHYAQDSTLYQYNTQGALTKLSNAHFSEHLFYADSLPNYATPYYNGNISATSVYLGDSAYHFAYDYDDYNRLGESFHLRDSILHTNEYFEFDVMGNLNRLQRYSLQNRLLDDLAFTLEGNCIRNIVDYATATDLYDTKEYYDRATATDIPDMLYDANGNLKRDSDRNIDSIKYNIYNLPDTVIFSNGNKIINHYTASGNKWKTEYHTIIDAMYLPNTADGTVFEGNLADIHYTIYDGNIEYKYIVNSMGVDSLYEYVIHNTEGYIAYHPQNNTMTHYYYHQDHLGNICAVWDATHDSIVQQTLYYASGLPVSVSTGQDVQPYKYNGKEFVEMHGYDVYEYGARGYYATIGRFTSIDPLCEQTPWQSPYVYANNNWVNNIDWMGMSADGFQQGGLNFTVVDSNYEVVYHVDNGNHGVYILDEGEEFDKNKIDWGILNLIGVELPYVSYIQGKPCLYLALDALPFNEVSYSIKYGRYYATPIEVRNYFESVPFYISALFSISDEILQSAISKVLPKYSKYVDIIPALLQTANIKNLSETELMLLPVLFLPTPAIFTIYMEVGVPLFAEFMMNISQGMVNWFYQGLGDAWGCNLYTSDIRW